VGARAVGFSRNVFKGSAPGGINGGLGHHMQGEASRYLPGSGSGNKGILADDLNVPRIR
jgi:hypothetical protein